MNHEEPIEPSLSTPILVHARTSNPFIFRITCIYTNLRDACVPTCHISVTKKQLQFGSRDQPSSFHLLIEEYEKTPLPR